MLHFQVSTTSVTLLRKCLFFVLSETRRIYLFSRTSRNLLDIFYVHLNITSYYFALKRGKSKKGNCIYSWPVSKRYQVYWIQFLINGSIYGICGLAQNVLTCVKFGKAEKLCYQLVSKTYKSTKKHKYNFKICPQFFNHLLLTSSTN